MCSRADNFTVDGFSTSCCAGRTYRKTHRNTAGLSLSVCIMAVAVLTNHRQCNCVSRSSCNSVFVCCSSLVVILLMIITVMLMCSAVLLLRHIVITSAVAVIFLSASYRMQ